MNKHLSEYVPGEIPCRIQLHRACTDNDKIGMCRLLSRQYIHSKYDKSTYTYELQLKVICLVGKRLVLTQNYCMRL